MHSQFQLSFGRANQLSGDTNCELFPQDPIIPVPPSAPPYRPVGACGNNWAVFPGRHVKRKPSNRRVRGQLFPLFRWWLCSEAMPKQYQAVLGSTKTRVQKPVPAIPTRWRWFRRPALQLHPVFAGVFRAVRKTAGHKFQLLIAKRNRARWLSHEFIRDRRGSQCAVRFYPS